MSRKEYIRTLDNLSSKLDEYIEKYNSDCYKHAKDACNSFKDNITKENIRELDLGQLYMSVICHINVKEEHNEDLLTIIDRLEYLLHK